MKTLKDRLTEVMAEKGWKQIDIHRRTGISKGLISLLLSDPSKDLLMSNLFSIAEALQVDPVWIYTGQTSAEWLEAKAAAAVPAEAPAARPCQRKASKRLKRSQFYPRAFFH